MDQLAGLLPIFILLVFAYLLLIRPARKRAHEVSRLQSALSRGDRVMLNSGIFGTVTDVVDEEVGLEVSSGVVLRVHRGAIGKIIHDEPADDVEPAGHEALAVPPADTRTDETPSYDEPAEQRPEERPIEDRTADDDRRGTV